MDPNDPLFTHLQQVQTRLGLTDRDTQLPDLIAAMTHADPQRRADLEFYANTFRTMAQRQLPIHASDRRELDYFRLVLRLQAEEIQTIEQRILTDLGISSDPFSADMGGDDDFSQFTDPAIAGQTHSPAAGDRTPHSGRSRVETPSYPSDVMATNDTGHPPNHAATELPPEHPHPNPPSTHPPTVQDSYAGSGSYAVTQPSKPTSRNKEAVQGAAWQKSQRQMGRSPEAEMPPSQTAESAEITPEMRDRWALGAETEHGEVPPTVAPEPMTETQAPEPAQPAHLQTELQPDGTVAAHVSPTPDMVQAGVGNAGAANTEATTSPNTTSPNTTTVTTGDPGIPGGNVQFPGNPGTSPPPKKKPFFLDTRFLIPLFMLLAVATGVSIPWLMAMRNNSANTVDPQRLREYMESGITKTQDGFLQQAIQDLDRAVQLNPKDPNAYINRGYAHHRAGDLNAAVRDYDTAIALDPNSARAFSNRSHARFDQGSYRQAETDAQQAIARDSTLPEAYVNLGNALFVRNDLDGASQQFQQALQLPASNPTKARAYNNRGNIFLARDQNPEAKQEYDQAIQLDSTYADAFFNRAIAQERMENWQAAADDFTNAAQLYQKVGRDRRSREAQVKADQARQRQQSTPMPPDTPPDPTQRSI